jgi:hypothetical protein
VARDYADQIAGRIADSSQKRTGVEVPEAVRTLVAEGVRTGYAWAMGVRDSNA